MVTLKDTSVDGAPEPKLDRALSVTRIGSRNTKLAERITKAWSALAVAA